MSARRGLERQIVISTDKSHDEAMCVCLQGSSLKVLTQLSWHHIQPLLPPKTTNNKCCRGCGEKGTLLDCWWGCALGQTLLKTAWRFLKKLKIELPYNPAIPLQGVLSRENPYLQRYVLLGMNFLPFLLLLFLYEMGTITFFRFA